MALTRTGPPPRTLPVLYFAFAHLALIAALVAVVLDPRSVAGFFYHPRMLAIVHLVTLGWISSSILGAIHVVGPLALGMPMPTGRSDHWAYWFVVVGSTGMVVHFWIEEFSGMAWATVMTLAGFAFVATRVVWNLRSAGVPLAVKLHVELAFLNLLGAGTMGILLGFDRAYETIPGDALANVSAHAHLAAIGWATMMVVGVGYRLLPMVLPSAMPEGRSVYFSAVLLEVGAVGLFVALLLQSVWVRVCSLFVVAGLLSFLLHVGWMKRHRRPAPVARARPDYGVGHAVQALVYLGLACILGTMLAFASPSEWEVRATLVYGVFGLIGFLAQMVIGMETRVLPWLAWHWAFANTGFKGPVPSPHRMPDRVLQSLTFYLWLIGVPLLAAGFYLDAIPLVTGGAWSLLIAAVLAALNAALILRHAFTNRSAHAAEQPAVLPATRG